ncbi:CNP1-like family protein [Caenimonas sp. SL110]|uniref:CNP1-like family protein n=1 Tax=Caenimonas sp. SL110 TaxID=1450524 RepID=UPI0013792DF7|nr:CNP1-like family protein [Caenimonas sp. SL110]
MPCRFLKLLPAALVCLATTAAFAQLSPLDPDWREADAPPPPALRTEGLIDLEMPGALLRFGVDPQSISVGKDGVVRYVIVAKSTSGAVNASYEGIRCAASEVRTYARHTPGAGWTQTPETKWVALSRHSLQVAKSGGCIGAGTNLTAADVVRDMRAPVHMRYRPEYR